MSTEYLPKPVATTVCDLCGKPMDTYGNKDRYALGWGMGRNAASESGSARRAWFTFFRDGGWNKQARKSEPTISWDFHGDCLIDTLTPLLRSAEQGADE